MAENFGEFFEQVRKEVNRGARHDAAIKTKTRQAIRVAEQNYKLRHMREYNTWDLPQGGTAGTLGKAAPYTEGGFTVIKVQDIRSVEFLRRPSDPDKNILSDAVDPIELQKIEPQLLLNRREGAPMLYWFSQAAHEQPILVNFDVVADRDYSGDTLYFVYSRPDVEDDAATNWFLTEAELFLQAQVMILMAPTLRNMKLIQEWAPARDMGLRTMLLAEEDFKEDGQSPEMLYRPEGETL